MFSELFYWLFELLRKDRPNESPGFDAYLGISLLQCMNILILFGVANFFLEFNISKNLAASSGIFLYIFITIVNFFTLFRKKSEIVNRYENLSRKRRMKGILFFWGYVLSTIVLFIIVLTNLVTIKY